MRHPKISTMCVACTESRCLLAVRRSPLQALLYNLKNTDVVYHIQQTPRSMQLSYLSIVSPSARVIRAKFSKGSVWLLDATYKTNRYGLPLLHVVGITSNNATFTIPYVTVL